MKSPFPGMDPYLEQHWRDVHHNLITFIRGALNSQLPEGLIARIEERIVLESNGGAGRPMYPDVRIFERNPIANTAEPEEGVALAEPVLVLCPAPEHLTEGFIEIIDVGSGNRLITVLEVVSPTNKHPGEGQEIYLKKQRQLLRTETNLVEIDLLRGGDRVLVVAQESLLAVHRTPYQICVRRGSRPQDLEFYPVKLQHRLPRFRIPLRPTDADIALDLQPMIDQCYRNGRYGATINYKIDPDPALGLDEAKWADNLLRAAGMR